MSEMLGNYFFLNQNYKSACEELENALKDDPSNNTIQRKLLLCYIKLGYIMDGYNLFCSIVKSNLDSIVHCCYKENPCPCLELIREFSNSKLESIEDKYYNMSLGILWLYCDIQNSIYYLNKAKIFCDSDDKLNEIINIITNYSKSINTNAAN